MNLRKTKPKEFHELPSWMQYYKKDMYDSGTDMLIAIDIRQKMILEFVAIRLDKQNYITPRIIYDESHNAMQLMNFDVITKMDGICIKLEDVSRTNINNIVDSIINNIEDTDDTLIVVISKRSALETSYYLYNKFLKDI